MFHTAVGHVEPRDIQYLLKSKRIEAKIKMKAFILVVLPALFLSRWKECSQNTCHSPWSSSCLSEQSTTFSRELLPLQRSNSRPTFGSRLSTQLSLHSHYTEGAEICTFILLNVRISEWILTLRLLTSFWLPDMEKELCSWLMFYWLNSLVASQSFSFLPLLWALRFLLMIQLLQDVILLFSAAISLGGIPHYGAVGEYKSMSPLDSTARTKVTK